MDLREYLKALDEKGELRVVEAEADVNLEVAEILRRVARGGPALLFTKLKGFPGWRLAGNLFSKLDRISIALNARPLEKAGERLVSVMKGPPPLSTIQKLKALGQLVDAGKVTPKRSKPLWKESELSLEDLPALKTWPKDAGRFLTFPVVVTRDPETGIHHLGVYRMQIMGKNLAGMHWHVHKRGASYYDKRREKGEPIEVAVAIGVDPALAFTAVAPVPEGLDSYMFAGLISGRPAKVSESPINGLLVPAEAEVLIEGKVPPDRLEVEGPFGDHMGYYTPPKPFPVFEVERIYVRDDPIFHATVVGHPELEDGVIGKGVERVFLPLIKTLLPEVVDVNLPKYGLFHGLAIVSIRKRYPGHAKQVAMGLLGLGQFSLTKMVVVVDHDVDVHDLNQVMYAVASTVDPQRDVSIIENCVADELDHASVGERVGGKMIVDATRKLKEEIGREWPEPVAPDPEVSRLVDERWGEYGIN